MNVILPSIAILFNRIVDSLSDSQSEEQNMVFGNSSGYREADLRLCFRICKKPVFS